MGKGGRDGVKGWEDLRDKNEGSNSQGHPTERRGQVGKRLAKPSGMVFELGRWVTG